MNKTPNKWQHEGNDEQNNGYRNEPGMNSWEKAEVIRLNKSTNKWVNERWEEDNYKKSPDLWLLCRSEKVFLFFACDFFFFAFSFVFVFPILR